MTALGGAGLALVQSNRDLNNSLSNTGVSLGLTDKEMRGLAISVADAGFPLTEVAGTFDILARAGVRNTEDLKASSAAFDALADATGGSAVTLADTLVPAFKALGEEIPKTAEELDGLTWLAKNTQVDMSDFGSAMNYVAVYGSELGVTLDDMIGIMAALESKGITGSAATRAFRSAINEAKDGAVPLSEALGLTNDEIDQYKAKVGEAQGITEEYSAASESHITLMDKLKAKWDEVTLSASGFLEPLQPVLAGMTALGPALGALPNLIGPVGKAIGGIGTGLKNIPGILDKVGAGAKALGAVVVANPILAIITAIALAAVLIWKNWDKIKPWLEKLWKWIKEGFGKFWEWIKGLFNAIIRWIKEWGVLFLGPIGLVVKYWDELKEIFRKAWEAIKGVFKAAWDWLKGQWDEFINFVTAIPGRIVDALSTVWDAITGAFSAAWQWISDKIGNVAQWFTDLPGNIASGLSTVYEKVTSPFKDAWDWLSGKVTDVIQWFTDLPGNIASGLSTVYEKVTSPFKDAWDWLSGKVTDVIQWFKDLPGNIASGLTTLYEKVTSPFKDAKDKVLEWLGNIGDWFKNLPSNLASWFSGLYSTLTAPFKGAVNAIIDGINWVIRSLNKIHFELPSWVPGVGGKGFSINISEIDWRWYAKGGIVSEPSILTSLRTLQPYGVIGERGPELVSPLGGGGAYRSANITLVVDGRTLARALAVPLTDELRLKTGMKL